MTTRAQGAYKEPLSSAVSISLVALGLLAIVATLWLFVVDNGDGEVTRSAAPVGALATVAKAEEAKPAMQKPNRGPVESFEVFAPKDPFQPLVDSGSGGGAEGDSEETGAGANQTLGTSGESAPSLGGDTVGGHRVRVVDIFEGKNGQRAQVQVDATVYTVDEGERFAANFQLLSVSGECATMLFGDDEFTLCEGEEILK